MNQPNKERSGVHRGEVDRRESPYVCRRVLHSAGGRRKCDSFSGCNGEHSGYGMDGHEYLTFFGISLGERGFVKVSEFFGKLQPHRRGDHLRIGTGQQIHGGTAAKRNGGMCL